MKLRLAIILVLVGIAAGIGIAAQLRAQPTRVTNPVSPFVALADSRNTLEQSQKDLKDQIKALRDQIKKDQTQSKNSQTTSQDSLDQLTKLRSDAGFSEQRGTGLVITLADSQTAAPTIDSIVHAADMRDVVNNLWQSGARAISINDQRLVANTSIDSIVNTVMVNNTKIANPFVIKAVGDPRKLNQGLKSTAALADLRHRQQVYKLIFNIEEAPDVTVVAFDGGISILNAQIKL